MLPRQRLLSTESCHQRRVAAFDPLRTLACLLGAQSMGSPALHIHRPKPLHGWSEFAGEAGIIVIGVLIARGAE